MIRTLILFSLLCILFSCNSDPKKDLSIDTKNDTIAPLTLELSQAKKIIDLPLHCLEIEYPNKLGQVLASEADLKSPKKLRPIFYGCFDWHSSAHGYWSIISLLKQFPEIDSDGNIKAKLNELITVDKVTTELAFFEEPANKNFERTYGWAWFLKLQEELYTWQEPQAQMWYQTFKPLEEIFVARYIQYLEKLQYPIRTGTHDNSAFSLALAHEYATTLNKEELKNAIENFAKNHYVSDENCPIAYEPSGHDFLSPCLQQAWLMSKVLPQPTFNAWLHKFMPQIFSQNYKLEVAKVSDRTDGHLVHLDGLNFSRATCLFQIAKNNPELNHLKKIAKQHFNTAFPNISNDDYMGSHWLGTFALQALKAQ